MFCTVPILASASLVLAIILSLSAIGALTTRTVQRIAVIVSLFVLVACIVWGVWGVCEVIRHAEKNRYGFVLVCGWVEGERIPVGNAPSPSAHEMGIADAVSSAPVHGEGARGVRQCKWISPCARGETGETGATL